MSDYSYSRCNYSLTDTELQSLAALRCTIAGLSTIACVAILVLLLVLRLWKKFTQRLVLYHVILVLIYSFATTFQWLGVMDYDGRPGAREGCALIGFLVQYTSSVLLVYTFILTLVLFVTLFLKRSLKPLPWEISSMSVSAGVPGLVMWVPFIGGLYGLSGPWCWITTHDKDCQVIIAGVVEQALLWYVPQTILMLISMILVGLTIGRLAWQSRPHGQGSSIPIQLYAKALKEYTPLMIYPIMFFLLNLITLASRVASMQNVFPLGLLYVHAISDPCWGLLVAMVTGLYVLFVKDWFKCRCCYHSLDITPLV